MKKFTLLFLLFSLPTLSLSAPRNYYNSGFDETPWQETQEDLPAYPLVDTKEWQTFLTNQRVDATLSVWIPSVQKAKDNSIRYVLNIRSQSGTNNITAEGINCQDNSYKIYAFGDTAKQTWLEASNPQWQKIGNSLYQHDVIRYQLKNYFCTGLFPETEAQIRKRLKDKNI